MTVRISKLELRLLGFLHEHARGYDGRYQFRPIDIRNALETDQGQLERDTSFLAQHRLAGVRTLNQTTFATAQTGAFKLVGLWLTGEGKNLMRKLEADLEEELLKVPDYEPAAGVKITAKVAGWLMDKAADVVVQIVAQAVTQR